MDGQEDLILSQREECVCRCSVSTGSEVWLLCLEAHGLQGKCQLLV